MFALQVNVVIIDVYCNPTLCIDLANQLMKEHPTYILLTDDCRTFVFRLIRRICLDFSDWILNFEQNFVDPVTRPVGEMVTPLILGSQDVSEGSRMAGGRSGR